MQRRQFIKGAAIGGTAAAAGAIAGFPRPAIAQGTRELKMVTTWPKNFPGLGTGAESLAKRVGEMTDGKLTIRVFAGGELVPPFESFDAVSSGNAEMSHSASYYWQGKSPAFNYFTTVPFGLTAVEHVAWINYGGGQELWDEIAADFNIKPFLRASTGIQMGGWFRNEVNSLEDFKGLKFRMPGLGGEVLRRIGAAVVNLPLGEIFAGLQAGTVDGTEWVGPWNDLAAGFYKVAKYYYWPGWHEPATTGEVMINRQVWEELPADQQALLRAAIGAEAWREYSEFTAHNGDSLKRLIDEHGVQLKRFPEDLLNELREVSRDVVQEVGNSDPATKKVYDSYIAFEEKMKNWTGIADQAFLNARAPGLL